MDLDNTGQNQAGGSKNTGRNVRFKLNHNTDPKAQDEDEKKRKKPRGGSSEKSPLSQMVMPYSIVSDLMHTRANITFGQLMNLPPFKNETKKAITPKRKRIPKKDKEKEKENEAHLGKSSYRNTPMICKGQIGGWTIDLILDSGSSTSIMSRKFLEHLGRQVTRKSERMITGIHGNKRSSLGIIADIPVHLGDVIISTDMEVIDTQAYNMVLGTDWLRKAKAVIDYHQCKVTVGDGNRESTIQCRNTTLPIQPQNEDSDNDEDDDDEESDDEEDYEEANLGLVVTEEESPDQHAYQFDAWGIKIDQEKFSWQEYDYFERQFNPWITNQKWAHQTKHWYQGPDKQCWCHKDLYKEDDKCEPCENDYSRWETIKVLPVQEMRHSQSLLVMGGADELENNEHRELVQNLLHKYPQAVAHDVTQLGQTNMVTHHINTGDALPIRQHYYRMSPRHEAFIKEEIERLKQQNLIVPSHSPWTSPALVVGKANGKFRLVIDYRQLNKVTKPDAYSLPKIADMLDALALSQYYSTLDLTSEFWQVRMNAQDQEKTAFSTKFGTYEFTVMPFGLMNAPATFQRLMDQVFYDVTWKFVLVYMDDIIIYSRTIDEHSYHLEQVFQLLMKAGLKLNPNKCDFFKRQILFLGHLVSGDGIKPNPVLVEKIKDCPPPKTKRQVRSFLGLASYYRRFIRNFSSIAKPLYDLTKQNRDFCWTEETQRSFNKLKECLTSPPVIKHPSFTDPFVLHTDASDFAVGAVLAQNDDHGKEHVIAYASRILNEAERHYTVTEKECLAVIWATKYFHHFLQGTQFSIVTDHEAIPWLKKHKQPKGRLARWIIHLSEYEPYSIIKRKGSEHTNADALSRLETTPVHSLLNLLY